jgi:hypothetical protein
LKAKSILLSRPLIKELPFTKLPQTKQTDALTWLWVSFHIGLPNFAFLLMVQNIFFNQKGAFSNSMTVTEMDSSYTLQHKIPQLLIQKTHKGTLDGCFYSFLFFQKKSVSKTNTNGFSESLFLKIFPVLISNLNSLNNFHNLFIAL